MQFYLILALLMALLVTVFAVQNNEIIAVTLFAWRIEGSLAIILMGTLFLGILIGVFLITPTTIRGRLTASDLRKKLQKSEQDLEEARKIQLFPSATSPTLGISDQQGKTESAQGEGGTGSPPIL
jgi:putative membrane protein